MLSSDLIGHLRIKILGHLYFHICKYECIQIRCEKYLEMIKFFAFLTMAEILFSKKCNFVTCIPIVLLK